MPVETTVNQFHRFATDQVLKMIKVVALLLFGAVAIQAQFYGKKGGYGGGYWGRKHGGGWGGKFDYGKKYGGHSYGGSHYGGGWKHYGGGWGGKYHSILGGGIIGSTKYYGGLGAGLGSGIAGGVGGGIISSGPVGTSINIRGFGGDDDDYNGGTISVSSSLGGFPQVGGYPSIGGGYPYIGGNDNYFNDFNNFNNNNGFGGFRRFSFGRRHFSRRHYGGQHFGGRHFGGHGIGGGYSTIRG